MPTSDWSCDPWRRAAITASAPHDWPDPSHGRKRPVHMGPADRADRCQLADTPTCTAGGRARFCLVRQTLRLSRARAATGRAAALHPHGHQIRTGVRWFHCGGCCTLLLYRDLEPCDRIFELWSLSLCGAMGIRTPDLLHAINNSVGSIALGHLDSVHRGRRPEHGSGLRQPQRPRQDHITRPGQSRQDAPRTPTVRFASAGTDCAAGQPLRGIGGARSVRIQPWPNATIMVTQSAVHRQPVLLGTGQSRPRHGQMTVKRSSIPVDQDPQ